MTATVTDDTLTHDLRRLGVHSGDILMLHISLRAVGPVQGGPEALLQAVEQAVGEKGTLLMILGAEIEHDWVNRLPETERDSLLAESSFRSCQRTRFSRSRLFRRNLSAELRNACHRQSRRPLRCTRTPRERPAQ